MSAEKPTDKLSLTNPVHCLALGFGSGLAPKAPGTFGSLAAVPVWWLLSQGGSIVYALGTLLAIAIGPYICGKTARDMGVHDHGSIVWDEVAGYLVTMLFAPISITAALLGFGLFRAFDILKPWPISWLDKKMAGGTGIMADDILAGVFAAVVLQLLLLLL